MEAPDSWEEQAVEGVSQQLSASSLNTQNSASTLAGKNVFAKEFVPSFGSFSQPSETIPSPVETSIPQGKPEEPPEAPQTVQTPSQQNGSVATAEVTETAQQMEEDSTAGNWSDKASEDEESSTMDEGADDNDSDKASVSGGAKSKSKKKPKVVSNVVRKNHFNIIFIGHVDAGKSTIGGHIMFLTGMVDKRTLEKYEKEAKEKNRESWYLSWALDTNQEERDKGKTVEVGRAYFETDNKHFTILDAPGHKSFVPNMIGGASQADLAVLVISARKGEFETGFDRGGQTREHAMLVKTAGVRHLIIVVNKMDDSTVNWDEARFKEIKDKLTPYLKKCGFNPRTDLSYVPVSGLTGANLKETNKELCPWYTGPSLITYLDDMQPISRVSEGPLRLPVVDRYKDMGTIALGKIESGTVNKGAVYTIMPNRCSVEVMQMWSDEEETEHAFSGENVKLKFKNIEDEDISAGFVLCSPDNLCHTAKLFDAQVAILEYKSIICAGYSPVLHIHSCVEQVTIKALICLIDKKTNAKSTVRPRFIKQDQVAIIRLEVVAGMICLEPFKDFPQMGRFTLRDEGKTIAIGKVLKVVS